MVIKLGELEATMSADIKKTDEVKVRLKVGWSNRLEAPSSNLLKTLRRGTK